MDDATLLGRLPSGSTLAVAGEAGAGGTPTPGPVLPAEAEIDLGALRDNVRTLKERVGPAEVMAVVKADAYGHGLLQCSRAARQAGATWLGVAQLAEALTLRAAGDQGRLLSWLHVPGDDFTGALKADVDLSASAVWAVDEITAAARATGRTARVHLKIDTGLSRNGAGALDWVDLVRHTLSAQTEGALELVGVWSHLACADTPQHPSVRAQADAFADAVAVAEGLGARLEVRHLANSAAVLTNPSTHHDLVRVGLAAYGLSPVPDLGSPADFGLRPVMTLRARLALVKHVPAGAGVSYGHTYLTPCATTVGLVPVGYADGLPRAAGGAAPLQVVGRRHVIAGRVCMDQVVVDLGARPDVADLRAGDPVVLFGPGLDGEPTAQEWADAVDTISYEIVARIGSRVPRTYRNEQPSPRSP